MTNARVGATLAGRPTSDVEVFPNDRASARTLVHVEERSTGFVVVGATADEITVDTPHPNDALSSPLTISGKSVAFEATVGIQLRPADATTPVFEGNTNGGSTELQPFSTTITPPAIDQPLVLVVFEGDASGAGTMTKATVIPLAAAGAAEPASFFDADESGRHLLWVDVNHDLWKWSGGEPVKVDSGFNSAAW